MSELNKCKKCGEKVKSPWLVDSGTPAGNFLDLSEDETVPLHDNCYTEIIESM